MGDQPFVYSAVCPMSFLFFWLGEPKVNLEKKSGALKIDGIGVCSSTWDKKYAHLVCQQLNLGNALPTVESEEPKPKPREKYYHVKCEDYHSNLGQCSRFRGECGEKLVSVRCVGTYLILLAS